VLLQRLTRNHFRHIGGGFPTSPDGSFSITHVFGVPSRSSSTLLRICLRRNALDFRSCSAPFAVTIVRSTPGLTARELHRLRVQQARKRRQQRRQHKEELRKLREEARLKRIQAREERRSKRIQAREERRQRKEAARKLREEERLKRIQAREEERKRDQEEARKRREEKHHP
jgi:hypothetical protein